MKISKNLVFVCDPTVFSGVRKIAKKVALDVAHVFDFLPEIREEIPDDAPYLLFGTVGKSELIEKSGKIDSKKLAGKNEVYDFCVDDSKNGSITICGSDKRGTIYGLFHFSELIGVSPLINWCYVMPEERDEIEIPAQNFISKEPSVRFRGFFINDEWPAFGNWANKLYGGFNSKMYEKVFELLLRLKGNYLWPAMWSSRFSDDGPGLKNAELADELGVIMGASHHEPCCRAGEEYKHLRGKDSIYGDAWNFRTNEKGITKFWEDGLKRNGKFENVITVGMRGEADTAIMKNATLADNINLLRDVIHTQNSLIKKYVNEDLNKVPRMLALYKEVEPYFYGDKHTKGLMNDPELDGVTLMLCDDNHGNLRTVPTAKMRSHKGGYGLYYHFDYHGWPYSYEWINTTALPKVKEQICAAYDFGIKDLWIVNVGDIMTNEFPLNYFMDLAYDYEKYSDESYTTQKWTEDWVKFNFAFLSDKEKSDVNFILNTYTKLAHMRRTECIKSDTFSPINYGESDYLLNLTETVISKTQELYEKWVKKSSANSVRLHNPYDKATGLFAQVIYPACGTMNVLKMQLMNGKNKWHGNKGTYIAGDYAIAVNQCLNFDAGLLAEYNSIAGGEFYAMGWSEHFGFTTWCEAENQYPVLYYPTSTRKKRIIVYVEGNSKTTTGQDWTDRVLHIDSFKNPDIDKAYVCIASCTENAPVYDFHFTSDESSRFLTTSVEKGFPGFYYPVNTRIERIMIQLDREKLSASPEKKDTLVIESNDGHGGKIKVFVEIDANVPNLNYPAGTFVQTENYVSMEAVHFAKKEKNENGDEWKILPDYGKTAGAVKSFPVIKSYPKGKNAPYIEYNFAVNNDGVFEFDFYLNPSNPAYKDNKLQFIAEINGEKLLKNVVDKDFAVGDNQPVWGNDVTNNIRIADVYAECKKGLNSLKIYPVTPNIVLEKIVIYEAGTVLPYSYLGPSESYRVK